MIAWSHDADRMMHVRRFPVSCAGLYLSRHNASCTHIKISSLYSVYAYSCTAVYECHAEQVWKFFIDSIWTQNNTNLSQSNSPDSAGPARKLVLCVQLLSCVYISSVPVQQCVHLLSTALQQLCVHYLPNTVALKDSASWKKYFPPYPESWRKRQVYSRA